MRSGPPRPGVRVPESKQRTLEPLQAITDCPGVGGPSDRTLRVRRLFVPLLCCCLRQRGEVGKVKKHHTL